MNGNVDLMLRIQTLVEKLTVITPKIATNLILEQIRLRLEEPLVYSKQLVLFKKKNAIAMTRLVYQVKT